jgi:Holliday junction DNA helicase RuvA
MIGYLSGKILDHSDGKLLVAVGSADAGTVGYSVMIPESEGHVGLVPGNPVELFIYTHVREDSLDLFGFRTAAEKDLFLTLLSVSGIGPKLSLTILSGADPGQLIAAILKGDKAFLSRIPGIGKKTAERIVLELVDKIQKKMDAGVYAVLKHPAAGATAAGGATFGNTRQGESALMRDATLALVGLGYREQDAATLLHKLMEEAETPPQKVEDLIRSALRQMT